MWLVVPERSSKVKFDRLPILSGSKPEKWLKKNLISTRMLLPLWVTCQTPLWHIQFSHSRVQIAQICRQTKATIPYQRIDARAVSKEPLDYGQGQLAWNVITWPVFIMNKMYTTGISSNLQGGSLKTKKILIVWDLSRRLVVALKHRRIK